MNVLNNEKGVVETAVALFVAGLIFGLVAGSGVLGEGTSATNTGPGHESSIHDTID